jgi:polyhydroxybutyrate depolymerase
MGAAASNLLERRLDLPGGQRFYTELVPPRAGPGSPLVILLHSGGGSMRQVLSRRGAGTQVWPTLARRAGFVLVAPNGSNPANGDTDGDAQIWNDFRGLSASRADDVGFIAALIERVAADHRIDRRRVYVTGGANGGMMAYRLLIERPALFAAGATFLANLPAAVTPYPGRPMPVLVACGTEDRIMPFEGGWLPGGRGRVRSAEDTAEFWRRANGVAGSASVSIYEDRDPSDGCRIVRLDWQGRAPVSFLRVVGGGHQMPFPDSALRLTPGTRALGPACRDASGAEIAWDFLSRHSR